MKFIHAFLVIQFYFPFANKNFLPMSCEESPPTYYGIIHLGCVCFRWKWFPEIIFTLFRMFGCHGKWLPVDQYFHLWPGNDFLPSFSLQSISGKRERERERERACARERGEETEQSVDLQAAPISSPSFRRHRSPVRAPGGAISRRREIVIASSRLRSRLTARDRAVTRSQSQIDREITPARARAVDREIAPTRSRSLMIFFLGLCFPSSFPNTKKYFPENFLKCNQTQRKIFLFRKLAFPKNMYFPENVLRQPNTALIIHVYFDYIIY